MPPLPKLGGFTPIRQLNQKVESQSPIITALCKDAVGRETVVKCVLESPQTSEALERIQREITIYQLGLRGIPNLLNHGSDQGFRYFATQYLAAANLHERIQSSGPIAAVQAIPLALRIAEILAELHSHGWLHGDLKPANLLFVDGVEDIYAIDFGLAKHLSDPGNPKTRISGTPAFLSPEVIEQQTISPASDVYSFGCTLYFLLTGRPPITGSNPIEICWKQVTQSPEDFSPTLEIPDRLAELVMKCLSKNPSGRPQSFDHMRKILALLE